MNFLTLDNVTKSYGPKILFKNINLFVNKGDRIALVAKNGSGKSTLLASLDPSVFKVSSSSRVLHQTLADLYQLAGLAPIYPIAARHLRERNQGAVSRLDL